MIFLKNLFSKINKDRIHDSIKTVLSLRSDTISDRILERYIAVMLVPSLVWLFDISIFNTSIKVVLCLFITVLTAMAYIMLISKGQAAPRSQVSRLDKWMHGVFGLNIIVMFMKIMSRDYGRKVYYEVELAALILVIAYFILSCAAGSYRYYLILLPVSAIIVYVGVLVHFLRLPAFVRPLALLLNSPRT